MVIRESGSKTETTAVHRAAHLLVESKRGRQTIDTVCRLQVTKLEDHRNENV